MKLRRALCTVVLAYWSGLAAAQDSDVRHLLVPTPPFEVTSPDTLNPDDLRSADATTTIRNLTTQPLQVRVIRTLRGKGLTEPMTEPDTFHTIAAWSTLKVINGTPQTAMQVRALLGVDATRELSLDLRIRRGTFAVDTQIPVAYPTAATATALLADWKITRIGSALDNAVIPIDPVTTMSCQEVLAGWVKGDHGALKVMARPVGITADAKPAQCAAKKTAPNVQAVQISLNAWPSGEPGAGEYAGSLTLPVKGGAGTVLKLTVLDTWPWWLATLCILAGVLVGLVYRWLSDFFTAIQQDRADAADAQLKAQQRATALNVPLSPPILITPFGQRLFQPFSAAVKKEYEDLDGALRRERGLTRDTAQRAVIAKRLAVFQDAPSNYTRLVTALDSLAKLQAMSNSLGQRIAAWLGPAGAPDPTIPTLSETRTLAELYLSLHPVWLSFETIYEETCADLVQNRQHFLNYLQSIPAGPSAALVTAIASDLRDAEVKLHLARDLLNTVEPTAGAAAEIRSTLTWASNALRGAVATLSLLPSAARPAKAGMMNLVQPSSPSFVTTPPTPLELAQVNVRRQYALLGWSNAALTLLSAATALLIGLNSLYWGKTFGPTEAWQAFAWGLGTKLGLDALYTLADRLLQRVPGRSVVPTA